VANEVSPAAHWPILGVQFAVLTHGTSFSLAEMWGIHLACSYRNGRASARSLRQPKVHAVSQVCIRASRHL